MDKNQKPMADENTQLNNGVENNSDNYTFVQERIVSKKRRFLKVFVKLLVNVIVPVCVCLLVINLYFISSRDRNDDTENVDATPTYNGIQIENSEGESSNIDDGNAGNGEETVTLEDVIKKMTVVINVVRRKPVTTEEETTVTEEETTEEELSEEESTDEEKTDEAEVAKTEVIETITKYTGVVIAANGPIYILIPASNLEGYDDIYTNIGDQSMVPATVFNIDETTGLALLKIEASKITPDMADTVRVATFEGNDSLMEGQEIVYCGIVVGNSPMFFKGHISNSSNVINCLDINYDLIITDIMYSNVVDGFIFNNSGHIIGVAGMDYGELELPGMIACAKAIDLRYIINNMLNDRNNIYFGIVGQDVSPEIEEIAGGSMPKGIYVKSVAIDSPAYNAGIMAGDIITAIGNKHYVSMSVFREQIEKMSKGDTLQVKVKRRIGTVYNTYTLTVFLETIG